MNTAIDIVEQIIGLGLLIGGIWFGYRRWVAPYGATLDPAQRNVLLLLILTLAGAVIGSPVWWLDDPRAFAWDLPPLAGRMLAAAGWSFIVPCLAALRRPTMDRLRLALALIAVYLIPLAGAIVLFHRDRFDPGAPITYGFFTIVMLLILPTLWFLFRPPAALPGHPADSRPAARLTVIWLAVVAVVTGVWGLALFLTDQGPSPLIWVWPGDMLTSRLIGVMLLTIMAGAWLSRRSADLTEIMARMVVVYGAGLALASLWGLLAGQPIRPSYAVVFGLIAAISALMPALDRRPRPRAGLSA